MKLKRTSFIMMMVGALVFSSCNDLLEEQPRTQIVPSFFSTPGGLLGGIAGVYNSIRGSYGTEGYTLQQMAGTDEHLRGGGAGPDFFTYNGIDGNDFNGGFGVYTSINTLNGILEIGPTADLTEETKNHYLGQAYFLRAFLYFDLVQTFGEVPLHTEFVTVPSKADKKATLSEIYEVIISDSRPGYHTISWESRSQRRCALSVG